MNYLSILTRLNEGKQIPKKEWDFDYVMMKVRNLVEKYQLTWNPEEIITGDVSIVDRVYQAGLELIKSTGVYYQNTGRVIHFTEQEIDEAINQSPKNIKLGLGKDQRNLYARSIQDKRPPIIWGGNPGVPTPESLFLPMVLSWMKEPIIDLATCGSLTHVNNIEVRTGEPAEILATRRELELLHMGLKQVGRPGMGLLAAQSSVSELGDLAAAHPAYLRTCDAHLIVMLNELIFDQKNLARVINALGYGMFNASLPTVMVGGLGGDAPGSAVLQVASFLAANIICKADYHLLHPIHIRHVATSTRAVMWVQSVVSQAFARNAPSIIVGDIYPKSGAFTKELLYEVAANAIVLTTSGAHLEGVGSADGACPHSTGLECRWMGEIGHAVAAQSLSLEETNHIVRQLLEKYEHIFGYPEGNLGQSFEKAYDLDTLEPVPEWNGMYLKVKEEVKNLGFKQLP